MVSAAQDASSFAFGCAAPDAVVDAVVECVAEAVGAHRAVVAHALCVLDAETIGWEELGWGEAATVCADHPGVRFRGLVVIMVR
jgi:hypothetical protein